MTIEPAAATVVAGTPQPFVATVTGAANADVDWSVQEGVLDGEMSETGVYTAPTTPGTYHVVATSTAASCASATAEVTVEPAPAITVTISPEGPVTVDVRGSQTFLATVTGTDNAVVTWSVQPGGAGGNIDSVSGIYTAPGTTSGGTIDYVVATSEVDSNAFDQVQVNILTPSSDVFISPTNVTVPIGGRVEFTVSADKAGQWFVDDTPFGSAAAGTITGTGVYIAPYQMPTSTTAVKTATIDFRLAPPPFVTPVANSGVAMWATRFLEPEAVQVDACVPQCAVDEPNAIVAADFNNDGLSDLATANSGTGTLSLLLSADESHFSVPYRLQVGDPVTGEPQALVVANLNQDETPALDPRLDLVIADADASTNPSKVAIRTRLGTGDGTFGAEGETALPSGSNPLAIAVGHFDSTGYEGVAVANFLTNTVDILRGTGTGTFQLMPTITTGVSAPLGIATADFNGDSWDDLAVANSGSDTVSIYLSNADGTFAPPQIIALSLGSSPSALAVVSFDGDNYPDLVVTTTGSGGGLTAIFNSNELNNPSADPRFLAPDPPIATGTTPVAVAIGNFNGDAAPDVVVANQDDDTIKIYLFDPANDMLVQSETYTVGQTPQALAVGDFNGDGWPDVAVANNDDDTVSILRNRGGPTSTP
ncbi:MAG: FG-GAP repeat domain-containing protein [Nitrospirota bacterium]